MPDFVFELPDDRDLFDEPFTITLDGNKYNLVHRGNPPDEDETNPETKPLSYFRELVIEQVAPDERDAARKAITDALNAEPPRLGIESLAAAFHWISEERRVATEKLVAKVTKRPTGARSRSQSS